jgi:hypothetical protein
MIQFTLFDDMRYLTNNLFIKCFGQNIDKTVNAMNIHTNLVLN